RHTRFSRDWSSDVCSSDLACVEHLGVEAARLEHALEYGGERRLLPDLVSLRVRVAEAEHAQHACRLLVREVPRVAHTCAVRDEPPLAVDAAMPERRIGACA